ncbi:unnamed protein product [Citrullus colocynthis]|uniref:Uncharacterized protein n=1 Tax=Citrullus colocynthis TaxID=252529 RepID=A0ABP0Z7N6_9ROSI
MDSKISSRHHTRLISDSRHFRRETPEQSRRHRRTFPIPTYKMAQISEDQSILVLPSNFDRRRSDKGNSISVFWVGGPFSRRDLSHLDCVGIDWLNFPSRIVLLRLIEA